MKFYKLFVLVGMAWLWWGLCPASAGEDRALYSAALKAANEGQQDLAFMRYRSLLRDFPKSRFQKDALFAVGEYYFLIADKREVKNIFQKFIQNYPEDKRRLYAQMYLLKMAELEKDEDTRRELTAEIIKSKHVSLVFKEFKEYQYRSPLNRMHRVVYYIDRIEFFTEGELCVRIPL